MAQTTPSGSGEPSTTTPTAAYINLTLAMQAFYAARGMWIDGRPQGALVSMLGERTPWKMACSAASFWVTPEQIQALRHDLSQSSAARVLSGQQVGQFMRRLREAEARAGLPIYAQRVMGAAAPQASTPVSAAHPVPFAPLVCPPAGTKVRQAFEKHVFDCLHDVITFSQQSIYQQEAGHV